MIFPHFTLLVILGLFATLFSVVTAKPILSNAERLRRGLPLNKPVLRHPSRTRRDPTPSALPLPSYGLIKVNVAGRGTAYLTQTGVVWDVNLAEKFVFIGGSGTGLALTCENCGGKFVGLSSTPAMSLKTSSDRIDVPSLLDGDDPTSGKQVYVWSFNPVTKEVSINWANADGTSSSNQGLSQASKLIISGDPSGVTTSSWYFYVNASLQFVPVS
ncbi:hypothetical protein DL96DRAFT_1717927 [Flagelloscypha sp. PMI_526]|nr:hypothetical protein DL96DRAFT_1717927 [Flagelloscypha sp. PMI_526]